LTLAELGAALRRGELPEGAELIKRNPVRLVARRGDALVKVWLRPSKAPAREARGLREAARRGVSVPELLEFGADWIATRFIEARPAVREDMEKILPVIERMHAAGMLHGDLHLGNVLMQGDQPLLLDLQRARFLPVLPRLLRARELGYFAYSLGDPLPPPLERVRFWRSWRAQRHWRSRTRRCLLESSGFTTFEAVGQRGFRRREVGPEELRRALTERDEAETLKQEGDTRLYRSHGWIVKQYPTARAARRAWINARGLEARGLGPSPALAWAGPWLVMRDIGPTVIQWVEQHFDAAPEAERLEMAGALGKLLGTLHDRGIYHADLKANNIAWTPGAPPRLLDSDQVRFGIGISRRRRIKNLAQLNAALPDLVPGPLRERALRVYTETCRFAGDVGRLRDAVIELSLRRAHRWSGC
jgi:tRNA A-37 threonylcarbamoyl transferase component Bud32